MFKKIILILCVLIVVGVINKAVIAQEGSGIEVRPYVIDKKTHAKDILEYDIILKNNYNHKVDLYAIVNDILPEEGNKDFDYSADKSVSLSKWINIKRGVIELSSGEEKKIPLKIKVNLSAKPGKYHAVIIFSQGTNRTQAELEAKKKNQPKVLINIEVEDEIIEKAQIDYFSSAKNVFFETPISFFVKLENLGNKEITPKCLISIYDRKGKEVDTLDFNSENKIITPGKKQSFLVNWNPQKTSGHFKAKLSVFYGSKEDKVLQDIIYFYYLPWQRVVVFVSLICLIVITLTVFLFKKTYHHTPQASHYIHNIRNGVLDLRQKDKNN